MVSRSIVRSSLIVLMGAVFVTPATAQSADGKPIRLAPISDTVHATITRSRHWLPIPGYRSS